MSYQAQKEGKMVSGVRIQELRKQYYIKGWMNQTKIRA